MRPDKPRDPVAGPDAGPESPYPIRLSGPVIKGFGRGSKDVCLHNPFLSISFQALHALQCTQCRTILIKLQLGIPTANIPADDLSEKHPDLTTGVYYGVVALDPKEFAQENGLTGDIENAHKPILQPAVLSIGYNPYYKNTVRSVVCIHPFLDSSHIVIHICKLNLMSMAL